MLPKPDGCKNCPMFGDGLGWVPDENVSTAKAVVLLQNPGEQEEQDGHPAVGATGDVLNTALLPKAGLQRGVDVQVGNALRCRYQHTNKLPSGKALAQALAHCRQYDNFPALAKVIVAAGAAAWQAFKGPGTITDWRGFLAPEGVPRVFGTLHPADYFRNPKMKFVGMLDWVRVGRYLDGTWPEQMPQVIRVPQDALVSALGGLRTQDYLVIDTEYGRESKLLQVLGIAGPKSAIYQVWLAELDSVARSEFKDELYRLVSATPVVFQNTFADVPVIEQNLGISYKDYKRIDDTMLVHAVLWSDYPHTLEFLSSVYGRHEKMKHLADIDPVLYNAGDVADTISSYEALRDEFKRDQFTKSVYEGQSLPLIPVILKRMARGIRVNKARVEPAITEYTERLEQATRLSQACAGWPINIGSDTQLKAYLYDYLGLPIQKNKATKLATTSGDAIATLRQHVGPEPDLETEEKEGLSNAFALDRVLQGANGVLEARVVYAAARQVQSHYLDPLVQSGRKVTDRIYPNFKIHAQSSGRWSITDPPLAQLPEDLRDLICPDPGMAWIAYDSDQIELRLMAALANDPVYLEAFARGDDVHTINARAIFDIPLDEAVTKEDPRRLFSKRFVYRLNYGGNPRGAGNIPGAKQLGLSGRRLVDSSNRYLLAHPAMAAWRRGIAESVQRTGVSRTFMGRRRRLLGNSDSSLREAYNHPLQGAAADILNTTIIQTAAALPYATYTMSMHDACWWEVPRDSAEAAQKVIREIAEQPWTVNGIKLVIPVKMKPIIYG